MRIIPMTADVSEVIGEGASRVDNHSLLIDKLVAPKKWVGMPDEKYENANRISMLRLAQNGASIIENELQQAKRKIERNPGNNAKVAENQRIAKETLPLLRETKPAPANLANLRGRHTANLASLLRESPHSSISFNATLRSRLAINLSEGLVQNAGISLDRIFSSPLIPGSAVKGCARAFAVSELKACPEDEREELFDKFLKVFGYTAADFDLNFTKLQRFGKAPYNEDAQGWVCFLPASPTGGHQLEVDLTNVHTPDYYTKNGEAGQEKHLAASGENPKPNYFPVVAAGTKFSFGLALKPRVARHSDAVSILEEAERWLKGALEVVGIGAKTSAGYGWFSVDAESAGDLTDPQTGLESKTSESGLTESEFEGMVNRAIDGGQRQNFVQNDLPLLQKPENTEWLRQFVAKIESMGGRSIKKMKQSDWFKKLREEVE